MKSTIERMDVEELIKILGEQVPVGVCITQDERICYCNSTFPIAIGYTTDELIGKDSLELIVPEDREMVRENTTKMLKGELLSPYQFRVIHKDGSIRWVMGVVRPIQYHGRRAVLGNYMEITERKQMEEALRESEERYKELANSITDVFFAMDEHLRYTYWNKASEILTGIRAEDALGKSLPEIFTDTTWRKRAEKVYRKVLRTQQPQTFVNDTNLDGRHYTFEISAYPSRSGISVFVRDITESKQAEEALRQSEERYRTMLEVTGDGYFETDLAGNFTFVNDALIRLFGYPREELIGMNYKAYTPEERLNAVFQAYNRMYKTGEPLIDFPSEIIRKDGSRIFSETSAFPIRNDKGEIVGFRGIRRDITERKKAEEALRQSEEKYRSILEEMEDSYFEVDLGGHIIFANSSTCRNLGYPREELIGMSYKGFTAEDDAESVFRIFNEVYQTSTPNKGFPWKTIRKDGSYGFAETSVSLLRNDKGEIIGFRGVGRDITERMQMEEALRESEKKLRLISENSRDIICLHAPDHSYIYVSPACKEILGYEPDELAGTNPWELVHPEDIEALQKEGQEKALQGLPVFLSYRIRKKSGEYIWLESISQMLEDDAGSALGFVTSSRDITERKQAEEALRQSEEKYRALFDSSVIGTFVLDAETMKIAIANQAAAEVFGFSSAEETTGLNPLDLVPPEDKRRILKIIEEDLFERDVRQILEFRMMTKDGREIWISATGARITHGGRLAGLISFTDITERKQAEEALRQSEERYRTILEEMEDSYFETDLSGRLTFVNSATCRSLRYSREELIGMDYRVYTHEDDIESVFRIFNEVYHTGVPNKGFPWKVTHKDGDEGFTETSVSLLRNSKGEVIGFRGVGRDITERKKMEEALELQRAYFQQLFDNSPDAIVLVDTDDRVIQANRGFETLFGYPAGENKGRLINELIIPEGNAKQASILSRIVLENGRVLRKEVVRRRKDGSLVEVSALGYPIRFDDKLVGAYIIYSDVTKRKRMEESIRLAAEEWRKTFDSISDAISIQSRDFQIQRANKAFAKLVHMSPHQLIGKHCYEVIHGTEGPPPSCPHQHTLSTKKSTTAEFYEPQLGIYIQESTSPIFNEKGELIGTVHISRDVTEQKRQNERLMLTDRLASIGELAAGTAHELNNPLTSVIGFSQLLMEKDIPDDIREDLTLIYSEAQRAAGVIKNLLAFARKHTPVKQRNQINN
ncbi:MAG TPA: PAS domain S-box protein, partial [Chloroflexi bacterium]|nr:PAS domain S-box protein [Chloroflexota bacterium]